MNRDEMIVAAIAYEAAHYADQNDMRFSSEVLADFATQQIATERKAIAVELRANVIIVGDDKRFNTFLAKLEKENE